VQEFELLTEKRTEKWLELERYRQEREAEQAELQRAMERRRQEEEEAERRRLRREAIHRANPIRNYKPVEVKPSDKPLTVAESPRFSDRLRSRTQHKSDWKTTGHSKVRHYHVTSEISSMNKKGNYTSPIL